MRELALRQTPTRLEVLAEGLSLRHGGDDSGIDCLLVSRLRLRECLLLLRLSLREELLLRRARTLLRGLGEVSIVDLLVKLGIS